MRVIGERIRARRNELGLTLAVVASRVGCARSYLSTIEGCRREVSVSEELLGKLERALEMEGGSLVEAARWASTPRSVKLEVEEMRARAAVAGRLVELLRREGVDAVHRSGALQRLVDGFEGGGNVEVARGVGMMRVPLINKVQAGYPREFTDLGYPARVADEYVSAPGVTDEEAFAARVVGDSMSPGYVEGDVVIFSPARDTVDGSDCFVRLEDGETTFKRVFFELDEFGGEVIRLQPLNASYRARVVGREEVGGLYAAVYVMRRVGE